MRQVHVAKNSMEAHFVRTLLEEQGIAAIVGNEMLAQATGSLPVDASTAPVVLVMDDSRADEAERIVAGIDSRQADGEDWKCSSCGQSSGPAFDACWSCGKSR
jgi:hypothetical protein